MDWISVDERMPEIGERVLVKDDFGYVGTGRCVEYIILDAKDERLFNRYEKRITVEGGSQFGAIPDAKYWMPIPNISAEPDSIVDEMCMAIARDELRRGESMHAMFERLRNGEGGEVKFAPFEKLPEAKEDE